jgi:MFS family permease
MQEVGAGWLMTVLSPDPLAVALVQAASTAPMFLLALPGGALADIVDRRRYLLLLQGWMAGVALLMALLAWSDAITPAGLLALTLALGVGSALMMPAWAALIPELVPAPDLPAAVVLSGVGMNIARAVGPALAGLIVSAAGPWATFLLNAVSFLGVMMVLWRWRPAVVEQPLPAERFFGALRVGLRYPRQEPALHAVLVRALAFFLCASAGMALLPLVVRQDLAGGANLYGGLLACVGGGAISGALLLPELRRWLSRHRLVMVASLLYALTLAALGLIRSVPVLAVTLLVGGAAWLAVLSSLQVSAQTVAPARARARPGGLHADLLRRHGRRQRPVGRGRATGRAIHGLAGGGAGPGGADSVEWMVRVDAERGRGPVAFAALADAHRRDRGGTGSRTRAGHPRI